MCLQSKQNFNPIEAFKSIDTNNDGYLTVEEFMSMFRKNGFTTSES